MYYDTLEKPFLGEERASKEYYMRSITDAGIVTSCASDFPVTVPPRTMDALHLMVNRKQPGHPEMEEMGAGETISVEDGLQVLTYGGAYSQEPGGVKEEFPEKIIFPLTETCVSSIMDRKMA